jgi:hypothetical protein
MPSEAKGGAFSILPINYTKAAEKRVRRAVRDF